MYVYILSYLKKEYNMCKKIAICGYSPTLRYAPFDNSEWLIYGMNHKFSYYKKLDLHFDLHNTTLMKESDPYYNFIKNNENKSVLTGIDNRFDKASIYPKKEIMDKYGEFFTCSASWILAYAIDKNPTDIGLFGIDCAYSEEYFEQRPSVLRMIGIAEGKGIRLHYPEECRLFSKKELYWNKIGKI